MGLSSRSTTNFLYTHTAPPLVPHWFVVSIRGFASKREIVVYLWHQYEESSRRFSRKTKVQGIHMGSIILWGVDADRLIIISCENKWMLLRLLRYVYVWIKEVISACACSRRFFNPIISIPRTDPPVLLIVFNNGVLKIINRSCNWSTLCDSCCQN